MHTYTYLRMLYVLVHMHRCIDPNYIFLIRIVWGFQLIVCQRISRHSMSAQDFWLILEGFFCLLKTAKNDVFPKILKSYEACLCLRIYVHKCANLPKMMLIKTLDHIFRASIVLGGTVAYSKNAQDISLLNKSQETRKTQELDTQKIDMQ